MKLLLILTCGIVGYVIWRLLPPKSPVGSALPNWNTPDRRNRMLRIEADQEYTLFH